MNDTNRQILSVFKRGEALASSEVHEKIDKVVSLVTVKRVLSELFEEEWLSREGAGRSVVYFLTRRGILLRPFDVDRYLSVPQEKRLATKEFNHSLFDSEYLEMLSEVENAKLRQATHDFREKADNNSAVHSRELQRFMVEMSWKSARIEGNTYTLLDTEKLLTYGIKSAKNTEFETQMLLNQKAAFDFIWETQNEWEEPKIAYIEKLHCLVTEQLGVQKNLRDSIIGITGTD